MICRTNKNHIIFDNWRGGDRFISLEFPPHMTCLAVQAVYISIHGTTIKLVVHYDGRASDLVFGLELPYLFGSVDVDAVYITIDTTGINQPVSDTWSRDRPFSHFEAPDEIARFGIKGVDM